MAPLSQVWRGQGAGGASPCPPCVLGGGAGGLCWPGQGFHLEGEVLHKTSIISEGVGGMVTCSRPCSGQWGLEWLLDWEAPVPHLRMEGRCGTERWRGRSWRHDGSHTTAVGAPVCVPLPATAGSYMRRINVILLLSSSITREKINLEKTRVEHEIVHLPGHRMQVLGQMAEALGRAVVTENQNEPLRWVDVSWGACKEEQGKERCGAETPHSQGPEPLGELASASAPAT